MTQLVTQIFESCQNDSAMAKSWLAMAISYAITADRIIKSREVIYMNALIQSMVDDPELTLKKNEILQNQAPSFEGGDTPSLNEETKELLLKCIIEICAVDRQIQYEEFQYLQKISVALGFSSSNLHHRLSKFVGVNAHRIYFDQLIVVLSHHEKKWLVLTMFHLSHIIEKELKPHLAREAYLFLGNRHELLEECQENAKNKNLFILPKISLTCEKRNAISMYLLKLLTTHCALEGKGLSFLQEIMQNIGVTPNQWHQMLNSLRTDEFLNCDPQDSN